MVDSYYIKFNEYQPMNFSSKFTGCPRFSEIKKEQSSLPTPHTQFSKNLDWTAFNKQQLSTRTAKID